MGAAQDAFCQGRPCFSSCFPIWNWIDKPNHLLAVPVVHWLCSVPMTPWCQCVPPARAVFLCIPGVSCSPSSLSSSPPSVLACSAALSCLSTCAMGLLPFPCRSCHLQTSPQPACPSALECPRALACGGTMLLSAFHLLSHRPTSQVPCEPGSASPGHGAGLDLLFPALSRHAPKRFMPSKFCSRNESLLRRLGRAGGSGARVLSRGCSAVSVAVCAALIYSY